MSKPTNSINKIKDTQDVVHEIVPHSLTDGNYQVSLPELKSDIVVPYSTLQGVSNCYDTSTTDTAGTWTTSIPNITELTEGLTIKIRLKTSYNGKTNTLNVNGLGAKTIYFRYGNKLTSHYGKESVLALTYTSNAISSGTDRSGWIVENIYDSTNTFQLRKYYSRYTTKSALYRYMICFVNRDNLLVPANNVNNSTENNKTLTTDSFDLSKGIYYYNSTTTVAAGKLTGTATLYQQIGLLDLRYSFNTGTTLTANKPVYLVVAPSGGYGEVILATNPIAQELPTASDGNRYVFLGYAYDNYRIELTLDHPIYVYNSIKETYISEGYSQDSNIKKNATDILNINNSISNLENNKVSKDVVATSTNLGLVKSSTTGTTADRDYNVQVNSDGTMKVNVPWTDTTYTFNGAVSTIKDSNLTASRALISNSSGKVAVSDVTSTELSYLDGVTSNVQTQLNGKVNKSGDTMTGSLTISSGSITAPQYNDAHDWPVIKVIDDSVTQISNSYTSTRIYSDTQPEWWLMGSSQGVLALKSDIPSSLKNPNALTFGSKTYDGSTAQTITASDLGAVSKSGDTMSGDLNPSTNKGASLGTSSLYWNNIYGTTIYENGTSLSSKYASLSDAITSVTWTSHTGALTFKNSAGTAKSTVTLPIKSYRGENYGECWTINAPNLEYSMQIGASGFTVDGEYPGAGQEYNILQVTDTTFTYNGNNVLHTGNIKTINNQSLVGSGNLTVTASMPTEAAKIVSSGTNNIDIQRYGGSNYRLIIRSGTASVTGQTMNTINLNVTLPNTSYMVILTERTNVSRNAYIPIVRGKTEKTFLLYLSTSGKFSYDYMVICMV